MNQRNLVLYIACCTADGSIMRCDLSENGTLSVINMLKADRPMYLAHNDKKLYALLRAPFKDNSCSGVLEIAIDEHDGFLPADRCISTGGIASAHICLFDDGIYTAKLFIIAACTFPAAFLMLSYSNADKGIYAALCRNNTKTFKNAI